MCRRCLTDLCEDEELRERITEIQQEIENSRLAKSRELSRRRSANIRRCRIVFPANIHYVLLLYLG